MPLGELVIWSNCEGYIRFFIVNSKHQEYPDLKLDYDLTGLDKLNPKTNQLVVVIDKVRFYQTDNHNK